MSNNYSKKYKSHIVVTLSLIFTTLILGYYIYATKNYHKIGPDPKFISYFLSIIITFLTIMITAILHKLYKLRVASNFRNVKHSIRKRIVLTFTLIVCIPTFLISLFSVFFINYGVKAWFHHRVNNAILSSSAIAEAYLTEHKENIRTDILFISNDIDKQFYLFAGNKDLLKEYLDLQANIRSLAEIKVFQSGKLIAATDFATNTDLNKLPKDIIKRADNGEMVIITDNDDSVKAIIKLQNFLDSYVIAGRYVDNKVKKYIASVDGAANEYKKLTNNLSNLQILFTIVFFFLSMLVVLIVIYYGIIFAMNISEPIAHLVDVTEKVKTGKLNIRSEFYNRKDEIGILADAFNKMISKIEKQHYELIVTNDKLDEKSRFNEKVLAGVSAGVIAVDKELNIKLLNPAAEKILCIENNAYEHNFRLSEMIPEFYTLLSDIDKSYKDGIVSKEIELSRDNKNITLMLNILPENFEGALQGYIITFDDITNLVVAQRNAAWADIARKIAHEMKNPLTPIRLAAERIRKKILKSMEIREQDNITRYTNIIISNVENITSMVNEFVDFARLPAPEFKNINLNDLITNALFTIKQTSENIKYDTNINVTKDIVADEKQLQRVLLNLLKNAVESLETKEYKDSESPWIKLSVTQDIDFTYFEIEDNGNGFENDIVPVLVEPYTTTKANGSGLGLAIVKKIVEDHGGSINFINKGKGKGAVIKFTIVNHNINPSKETHE